jgi:hypothetical protein
MTALWTSLYGPTGCSMACNMVIKVTKKFGTSLSPQLIVKWKIAAK